MKRRDLLAVSSLCFLPSVSWAQDTDSAEIYDTVVVGSGAAGLAAAVGAAQSGMKKVLVIEKAPTLGGHTILSTGYMSAVSPEGKSPSQYRQDVEAMIADMMRVGENRNNPVLVRKLVEESGSALMWLESMGLEWVPHVYQTLAGLSPRSYIPSLVRAGYDYVVTLSKTARSLGVEIQLRTRAQKLMTDAKGRVVGVVVRKNQQTIPIQARSVILATGGFVANVKLRQQYDPRLDETFTTTADPYRDNVDNATGDGLLMSEALGADVVDMDSIQLLPFWGGRLTDYVGADLYVNAQGHRFVNEASSWKKIAEAIWNLPENYFWVITDSQSLKGASRSAKLMKKIVRQAETIDEMARGMGIAPKILEDTIARYNGFSKTRIDLDFGKNMFTQDISVPPFYFGKEHLYVHYCCGGLRFDTQSRVLKKSGEPIEGLYAAGEVTGGLHGADRLGGCSITDCIVFGRNAGRCAARYVLG